MLKKLLQSVSVVLTLALVFSILTCAHFSASAAETEGSQAVSESDDAPFGGLDD